MLAPVDQWADEVAGRVLGRLSDEALPIEPKRIEITVVTDALDDEARRLLLVLPAPSPSEETRDREAVFKARRAAVSVFDDFAAEDDEQLPGRTVALVTTDDADGLGAAPVDESETDEDLGRRRGPDRSTVPPCE